MPAEDSAEDGAADQGGAGNPILPLFPLGTVLVPGLVLPLILFEPRYLDLAADLRELPEAERAFVVVAIRQGHEVGADAARSLHAIGTVARVQQMRSLDDGRVEVVTVGAERVRIGRLEGGSRYLRASAEVVPELPGADPAGAADAVRATFGEYRALLGVTAEGAGAGTDDLPADPGVLSYLVAAATVMDLPDRQALLEVPDDTTRLRHERARLARELAIIRSMPSLPAVDLGRAQVSPN